MDSQTTELRRIPQVAFQILDKCADAATRLVDSGGRHRIACGRGCNNCCADFIRVTHAEALLIAEWLLAPEREARLARFREQVAEWREATGPEVWILEEWISKYGGMPSSDPEFTLCARAVRAYQRRRLMCPFNAADGSCEIYPLRPSPCRVTYVVDTPEFCRAGGDGLPTVMRHASLTEITLAVRDLLREISGRAGCGGERALPNAVEKALEILMGGADSPFLR